MLNGRRLVIDTMCEVYRLLAPYRDEEFWDFTQIQSQPGSIYILGRQHLLDNMERVREMAESGEYTMIFDNSAEGSWTFESQIQQLRLGELATQGRLIFIAGAAVRGDFRHIVHEHLLTAILDYPANIEAQAHTSEIFAKSQKPYKFLFLNGRARPHRKYLYERLRRTGALDQALWTMLDAMPCVWRTFSFWEDDVNVMATPSPLQHLPSHYEVSRYRDPQFGPIVPDRTFLKQELFHREWGEIYLEPAPYRDTYFSLVTETVCAESEFSFRTEKIAKPLAMGHPFIAAANRGFYRDLHNLGFRTFGHLVDETFDSIDNAQSRMDRIIDIVTDLCGQDLGDFLRSAEDVCKYNQQHLREFAQRHRAEFPDNFCQFLQANG